MVEEAALLVESGAAFVLDDVMAHQDALAAIQEADKQEYLTQIKEEEDALAWTAFAASNTRKTNAMDKIKKNKQKASKTDEEGKSDYVDSPIASEALAEDGDVEESLFGDDSKPPPRKIKLKLQDVDQSSNDNQLQTSTTTPILPANAARFHTTLTTSNVLPSYVSTVSSILIKSSATTTNTHIPQPVPARYSLYKHLHTQGYYLSPGLRFGCQSLAYPGDPLRFHSHFLVNGFDWDEKVSMMSLVGGGRLGTGVKKSWMFGGKEQSQQEDGSVKDDVRSFCVEWAGFG